MFIPRPLRLLPLFVSVLLWAGLLPPVRAVEEEALRTFDLGGGVELEAVRIPAGVFTMGSPPAESGRNAETETPHRVILTRDFLMGVTPVTRGQWRRFAEATGYRTEAEEGSSGGFGWDGAKLVQRPEFTWKNPGFPQTDDHPAVILTVRDAEKFMQWLSSLTGLTFALPSEAQWEYACRAGTETAWWTGDDAATAKRYIWSQESAGNGTHPVQSRPANAFGLHIAGNVQEWCADWFAPVIVSLPQADPIQTTAPAGDKARQVLRGGGWLRPLKEARSAARWRNDPGSRNADNGFRVMSFGVEKAAAQAPPPVVVPEPPPSPVSPAVQQTRRRVVVPDSKPVAPDHTAPVSPLSNERRSGGRGWLWLLLAGGIVYWIIRRISKRRKAPPQMLLPYGLDEEPGKPGAGRQLRMVIPPGTFQTKPEADGFRLLAGYAAGTALHLYWIEGEGGYQRDRIVQYEPGEDGQFIYTGMAPQNIRVSLAEEGEQEDNPGEDRPDYPRERPVLPTFSPRPEPRRPRHDPPRRSSGGGGYRPSAY